MELSIPFKLQYITPDGETFNFVNGRRSMVFDMTGWGAGTQEFMTTHSPFQHGNTVTNVRMQERKIRFTLRTNGGCRDMYWAIRRNLLDAARISRTDFDLPEPGELRLIYLEDGIRKYRSVKGFFTRGLVYDNPNAWDEYSIQEDMEFTAHDPIVFDPNINTLTNSDSSPTNTFDINYEGTWDTGPDIEILGPFTDVSIYNVDTGYFVYVVYTVPNYETLVVSLSGAEKGIYLKESNTSLISYITPSSSLMNVNFRPAPQAENGRNRFVFGFTSGSPTYSLTWHDRYQGI